MRGKGERAGTVHPREERVQRDLINIYKYLMGGVKKKKWSRAVLSDAQRWGRRQWAQTAIQEILFHCKEQEVFFTVRMIKHWHRLPREIVASPSLELSKLNWTQP